MSVGVTIVAGHERSAAHVGGGGARVRLVDNTTGTWNRGHEKKYNWRIEYSMLVQCVINT